MSRRLTAAQALEVLTLACVGVVPANHRPNYGYSPDLAASDAAHECVARAETLFRDAGHVLEVGTDSDQIWVRVDGEFVGVSV